MKYYVQHQKKYEESTNFKFGAAVYIAVSELCLQAVDYTWLADNGFQFHHFRPAGHNMTISDEEVDDPKRALRQTAEFVYYCWPCQSKDLVPGWATSIEGSKGLCLSPDESELVLVWERGAWNTPGGAVDSKEDKLTTVEREIKEELGLELDPSFKPVYVGGYNKACARDNLINDNFSVFVVKATGTDVTIDQAEITEARWFTWSELTSRGGGL